MFLYGRSTDKRGVSAKQKTFAPLMKKMALLLGGWLFCLSLFGQIDPKKVTIARDNFGIPHIYGETDAEMVYGLAWAACEDNFEAVQENFLAARGRLAEIKGKEGAIMDVLAHVLEARPKAEEFLKKKKYSPEFQKMLTAYVQSINAYAKLHPEEILTKNLFPAKEEDVVAATIMGLGVITNVQFDIIKIFGNNIHLSEVPQSGGSNAFAANANKTADGNTYLCLNSHQPINGPYSWYEAHLNSEESDINIHGATFPGGMSLFIGANENLGWCHTLNYPDHSDVYKLKMHPKEKLQYELDGKWETLEEYPVKLRVKLGPIKLPIKKKFYKSKHGVVIKNKHGYYALRFPANRDVRAPEQWFEMNRAKNFDEFKAALELQYLPGTNVIYADKEGNIYYSSMGQFPKRDKAYNWTKVLPGNKSELIWEEDYIPFSELPQLKNPEAGYIYNTNNSPFDATSEKDDLNAEDYDITIDYLTKDNNRSIRARYLFEQKDKITFQDFKDIKEDNYYHTPLYSSSLQNLELAFTLEEADYPEIAETLRVIKAWDRKADPDRKAGVASIFLFNVMKEKFEEGAFPGENVLSEGFIVKHLKKAQKHCKKHFGKVDVTIGEVQRLVRGGKDYPVDGMPDVLAAMMFEEGPKGTLSAFHGDSFYQFVKYTPNGVEMEAINAFGQSAKEDSPHFDDQIPLFLNKQMRKLTLDKEEIMKDAKRVYHPGG